MEEVQIFQGDFIQAGKLWRRAIAYIADGFLVFLTIFTITVGYLLIAYGADIGVFLRKPEAEQVRIAVVFQAIGLLIYLSYFTYFIGKTGQSPGKRAMGLKVVNARGEAIGYKRALARYLLFFFYHLGLLGLLILIISAVAAAVDQQRRTLHDRICRTFVIGKEYDPGIEKIRREGKPRVSGPAIFALLLSIFCVMLPVVGPLLCAYVCFRVLYDIKQSNGLLKGKALAIAGLVISALWIIGFIVMLLTMRTRA